MLEYSPFLEVSLNALLIWTGDMLEYAPYLEVCIVLLTCLTGIMFYAAADADPGLCCLLTYMLTLKSL